MRKGFEGLYGLVRDSLQCEPLSGHIFVFSNRQRNRLKLLFWDNTGLSARGRNAIFSTDVFCRSELAIHAASPSGSSQAAQLAA